MRARTMLVSTVAAAALTLSACGGNGTSDPDEPTTPAVTPTDTGTATDADTDTDTSTSTETDTDTEAATDTGTAAEDETDTTTEGGDDVSDPPVIEDGDLPVWTVPFGVDGWEVTVLNQNGLNQFENAAGCLFTSSQNYAPGDPDSTDAQTSQALAEQIATALETQGESGESEFSRDTVPTGFPDQGPTEMVRIDTTYVAGGEQYQSVVLARTFNERDSWVSLQYACPADAYDEAEFSDLRDQVSLTYVEPSSL
ncbi:MAG: hypothetical protein Q4G67_03060 [Actinomycetia bacterium]|nr:hypothetical protein [Actinomycetes bacterium]